MDWEEAKELKDLRARLAECERRLEYSDPERGTQSFLDHEKGMEDRLAECEYQLQRQSEIYEGAADTEIERHYQEVEAWKAENRRLREALVLLDEGFIRAAYYVNGRALSPEYTERPSRPEWWSDTPARQIAIALRGCPPTTAEVERVERLELRDARLWQGLVAGYRQFPLAIAILCDDWLDRSGGLLGEVRAALAEGEE